MTVFNGCDLLDFNLGIKDRNQEVAERALEEIFGEQYGSEARSTTDFSMKDE